MEIMQGVFIGVFIGGVIGSLIGQYWERRSPIRPKGYQPIYDTGQGLPPRGGPLAVHRSSEWPVKMEDLEPGGSACFCPFCGYPINEHTVTWDYETGRLNTHLVKPPAPDGRRASIQCHYEWIRLNDLHTTGRAV